MTAFNTHSNEVDFDERGRRSRFPLFATAVGVLFVILATPLETALLPFDALLDVVYASPEVSHALAGLSGKFASSSREDLLRLFVSSAIVPMKKLGVLFSVVTLLFFALGNLRRAPWLWIGWRTRLRTALIMSLVLACCVLPLRLRSLGDSYARMSLSPFEEPFGILYRRLLMPALANLLGLSGYLLYLLFSLLLTVLLIYLVLSWFEKSGLRLPHVVMISIFTSSFVLYGFELPGYPDHLAMIFFMLMMLVPESPYGRLSLSALSLATHEASILMILPAALLMFPKRERKGVLLLTAAYGLSVIAGLRFDVASLLSSHFYFDDTGTSTWEYLTAQPLLAAAGVFVAFKLFWLLGIPTALRAWRNTERSVAATILAFMLLPLAVVPFAVDTSRFAGFGFFGLLVAVQYAIEHEALKPKMITALSLVNLVVPSVYIGLNSGMMMFPGVYRVLYWWMV